MKKFSLTMIGSLASMAMLMTVASCGGERNGWTLSGVIEGASDSTLFIEEPSAATWIIVDSLKADGQGAFEYKARQPLGKQAIYRLRLGDKAIYFPMEGTDVVTLTASAKDMDTNHRISGSVAARGFNAVDSLLAEAETRLGVAAALDDEALLDRIGDIILNDSTCIVSYYAIMHPVGERMYFNTDNKRKLGLIGAAATRYNTLRPGDDRGRELSAIHINAKKNARSGSATPARSTVEATLSGRPVVNFTAKDENGRDHDLNEVLDRGGVTIVNMTRYEHSLSSVTTAALGELYKDYKDKGLEIYQIGFDPNEGLWRQNASQMPWITVYCRPTEENTDLLLSYNANPIDGAPISFIFDKNGELVKRVTNPAELREAVATLF